jgi:hypothetical protein
MVGVADTGQQLLSDATAGRMTNRSRVAARHLVGGRRGCGYVANSSVAEKSAQRQNPPCSSRVRHRLVLKMGRQDLSSNLALGVLSR